MKFLEKIIAALERLKGVKNLSLGIDQGTGAIRYVFVDHVKKRIIRWGELPFNFPPQDKARRVNTFFKSLAKSIPSNQLQAININLQSTSPDIGRFQLASADEKEREDMIHLMLRNILSFPVENAVYYCQQYEGKPEGLSESGKPTFNYAAVDKQGLYAFLEPLEDIFKKPPNGTTQGYAFESLIPVLGLEDQSKPVAFLNIGRGVTAISVFKNGKLFFQRDIPLAGQDITRSILIMYRHADAPETMLELGDAEVLKQEAEIPISELGGGGTGDAEKNKRIFESIKGVLAAWVQDVKLSFHYYYENYDAEPIDKIYVLGGSSKFKNLVQYLNQQLGIPTELLKKPEDFEYKLEEAEREQEFADSFQDYATAFAFAIKDEKHAALGYRKLTTVNYVELLKPVFRICFAFVAALIFTWFAFLFVQNRSLSEIQAATRTHHEFLSRIEAPYLEMTKWKNFVETADAKQHRTSHILKALSQRIGPGILLSKLNLNRETGNLSFEGTIYGDAKARAVAITNFTEVLQSSGYLRNIEVPRMNPHPKGLKEGTFQITAELTRR